MAPDTAVSEVPQRVLDYMRQQSTLTLATASPTGTPWAATLAYVNDGATVYVWTHPDSQTARHIAQNPRVSFAIDEYAPDWRETKGIQGAGDGQVVLNAAETGRARELFADKFPALGEVLGADVSFFRISPTELRFIDNSAAEAAERDRPTTFHRELVFSIFRDLPEAEAETVAGKLLTVEVEAGHVVVRQGAPAEKFFIIVEGELEVVREEDGETRPIATLGPGQFFGEIAILRETPRMATVRALSQATLFAMERDVFRSLIAQSMGTTDDFDRVIRQRLTELGQPAAR